MSDFRIERLNRYFREEQERYEAQKEENMSELAQRILSTLADRSVGDIVTDDEVRQSVGSPELIEYSAACYEVKEAGYLEMVIGMKWRIMRKK